MFGRLDGEARQTLDMSLDKLARIVLLARIFDEAVEQDDPMEASDEQGASPDRPDADPVERELREAIDDLSDDEQAVLTALAWIGRGDFTGSQFDEALTLAFDRRGGPTSGYLMGLPMLGDLLEEGAAASGVAMENMDGDRADRQSGAAADEAD